MHSPFEDYIKTQILRVCVRGRNNIMSADIRELAYRFLSTVNPCAYRETSVSLMEIVRI